MEEQLKVTDGRDSVTFSLNFSKRKTLGITVTPTKEVKVVAPEGTEQERVLRAVKRRMSWILEQLDGFAETSFIKQTTTYHSGQTLRFLGRNYMLRVNEVAAFEEEIVSLEHNILRVDIRDRMQADRINLMIDEWYRNEALVYLAERFEALYQRVRKYGIEKPKYYLRRMDKRWGSCTPSKTIFLNPDLIQLPSHCIEYAIMHELCHLMHPDHSKEYYSFLDTVMPDWKVREQDLQANGLG